MNNFNYTKSELYQAAHDWAYDKYQSQHIWLRRVVLVVIILMALLSLSLLGNLYLLPLKEKVPYLYAFDHATGEVTKIGALESTALSANWQLDRYFLIHYVINYESYDFNNLEYPYQLVWAQSAEDVQKQYENKVNSANHNSPYQLYGKDKFVTVQINSLNRLNDNTVDIKFEKTLHDHLTGSEQVMQKEAIIKWQYINAETTQKMLDRDPLGFKVIYYQVSQVN